MRTPVRTPREKDRHNSCVAEHGGGFALDPPGLSPCASAEHRRLPEERHTHWGLEVESYLGVRVTKMLADPDSLMMLAQ